MRGMMPAGMAPFDPLPRVVLMPGLGAFCAGPDLVAATIARDITAQTLAVKAKVAAFGAYEGLGEADLFKMEYRPLQHAKLEGRGVGALSGEVALVTGAAGAIGSGVCRELLERGLPGRGDRPAGRRRSTAWSPSWRRRSARGSSACRWT